jgi:hypothetical protein
MRRRKRDFNIYRMFVETVVYAPVGVDTRELAREV